MTEKIEGISVDGRLITHLGVGVLKEAGVVMEAGEVEIVVVGTVAEIVVGTVAAMVVETETILASIHNLYK